MNHATAGHATRFFNNLLETAEAERGEPKTEEVPDQETAPRVESAEHPQPDRLASQQYLVTRALVAEALVFQELQREFGGAVKRQVAVPLRAGHAARLFHADGMIEAGGHISVVEVKLILKKAVLLERLRMTIRRTMHYRGALEINAPYKFIIAFVLDFDFPQTD